MSHLIEVTEEGIVILDNELHPAKVPTPISVAEEGIVICSNDEHSLNASSSIEATDERIFISFKAEQPQKAPVLIFDKDEGFSNTASINDKHPLKAVVSQNLELILFSMPNNH